VQRRCDYAPGEVRVIVLESEPTVWGRGRQRFEIYDAADGLLKQGSIAVKDMVTASPWLDESFASVPVEVDDGDASARRGDKPRAPAPVA
jgi:hypothetical protein